MMRVSGFVALTAPERKALEVLYKRKSLTFTPDDRAPHGVVYDLARALGRRGFASAAGDSQCVVVSITPRGARHLELLVEIDREHIDRTRHNNDLDKKRKSGYSERVLVELRGMAARLAKVNRFRVRDCEKLEELSDLVTEALFHAERGEEKERDKSLRVLRARLDAAEQAAFRKLFNGTLFIITKKGVRKVK
jgi:DNA-binding PadR family transcriptional regulator